MRERQSKEVTLEINVETYKEFKAYCQESRFDQNEIIEHLIDHFIHESKTISEKMRDGYAEMAHLNLEISSEFSDCENEVNMNL